MICSSKVTSVLPSTKKLQWALTCVAFVVLKVGSVKLERNGLI
jgi:hypothetical protein